MKERSVAPPGYGIIHGDGVVRAHPDDTFSWRAQVIAAPKSAYTFQVAADRIVSELRALYDLKDLKLDRVG